MNKRKVFLFIGACLCAVGVAFSINARLSNIPEMDFFKANYEALAQDPNDQHDDGEDGVPCGGPKVDGECEARVKVNCKDLSGCQ